MAITRRESGVNVPITLFRRRLNGAWVECFNLNRVKRRVGNLWVDCLPTTGDGALTISVSPETAEGYYSCVVSEPSPCPTVVPLVSNTITATAVGGVGAGPTYAWTYVSGNTGILCNSPGTAATTFSCNLAGNRFAFATWRCTATRGVDQDSIDVRVSFEYDRFGDGGIEP